MSKIDTGVSMPGTSILIPVIRNMVPKLLAQEIVGVQPMPNKAGSVFKNVIVGGHTFKPKYWPYIKTIDWMNYTQAERFCYSNFKSRNWRSQGQHFAFKREEDYLLFTLKWG